MARRLIVSAKDSRRWFGKPLPISTLNEALKELHDRVLPESEYRFDSRLGVRYEELLHELGHHMSLRPLDWLTPLDISIGAALEQLGAMTREGSEIDALGLSIIVSEMFGHPLTMGYVDLAVRTRNLKFVRTKRQARDLVMHAMTAKDAWDMAYAIANETYSILHKKGAV